MLVRIVRVRIIVTMQVLVVVKISITRLVVVKECMESM